jgi:8-oxo-dGTP diphosphatase
VIIAPYGYVGPAIRQGLLPEQRPIRLKNIAPVSKLESMKERATVVCWQRDRILLVERAHSRWSLPGGTIWRDETPFEAAARELSEETSLEGYALDYLFQFGGLNKRHHVFFTLLPDDARPTPCNEIVRCRWFRPRKVATLMASVPTRQIVALLCGSAGTPSDLDMAVSDTRGKNDTSIEFLP